MTAKPNVSKNPTPKLGDDTELKLLIQPSEEVMLNLVLLEWKAIDRLSDISHSEHPHPSAIDHYSTCHMSSSQPVARGGHNTDRDLGLLKFQPVNPVTSTFIHPVLLKTPNCIILTISLQVCRDSEILGATTLEMSY
ncbi:hypothetical protein Pcinc_039714 [Petrolisthes cinctipes]|uniref:Uncharacterized protein n=1 Tax=Petrolisthes cinctipes TaxID=88211 RepID=A0AAE1BN44_PETCI|nr:hypothetical protein Pcinc_039714 [Petrolisthes cinctipes]